MVRNGAGWDVLPKVWLFEAVGVPQLGRDVLVVLVDPAKGHDSTHGHSVLTKRGYVG